MSQILLLCFAYSYIYLFVMNAAWFKFYHFRKTSNQIRVNYRPACYEHTVIVTIDVRITIIFLQAAVLNRFDCSNHRLWRV